MGYDNRALAPANGLAERYADEFPVSERYVYLNHAAVAPLPRRTARAMEEFAEDACLHGSHHYGEWLKVYDATRDAAARLMNATPAEIAFVKNTSEGLSFVANYTYSKSLDNGSIEAQLTVTNPDPLNPASAWWTLNGQLIKGETLLPGASDTADRPRVAAVSERLARQWWPAGASPIGSRVQVGDKGPRQWVTIVGVVGDIEHSVIDRDLTPAFYLPMAQAPDSRTTLFQYITSRRTRVTSLGRVGPSPRRTSRASRC